MVGVTDFGAALPRGRVVIESGEIKGIVVTSDLPDTHQIRLLREALAYLEMPETPPQGPACAWRDYVKDEVCGRPADGRPGMVCAEHRRIQESVLDGWRKL